MFARVQSNTAGALRDPLQADSEQQFAHNGAQPEHGKQLFGPGASRQSDVDRASAVDRAANGLARWRPDLSAATSTWAWQKATVLACCLMLGAGLVMAPALTEVTVIVLMMAPFAFVVLVRLFALADFLMRRRPHAAPPRKALRDDELPVYSVLVPLFREAPIVPDLIRALGALDYPSAKLDIVLIVEHGDRETRAALDGQALPPCMRVIAVPAGQPRTKPRALNFALAYARGDYVAVYDAEDMPEPDQLRRALAAFNSGGPGLGCVQARLNIYNPRESWLTRQFTIEYTALFDAILPSLQRLTMPIPLGGTSNHFPRRALDEIGGWDAFNVTEDADLGLRLARFGWRVEVLASTTWEEAPHRYRDWHGQRTRWLKGWIRTYCVHMRRPVRLVGELGLVKFLGLQVLMAGLVLSPLVHPWFYLIGLSKLAGIEILQLSHGGFGDVVWHAALFNVVAGYLAAILLGMATVARRGRGWLIVDALAMPFYWLLISLAAYRGLIENLSAPHRWTTTAHRSRQMPMQF